MEAELVGHVTIPSPPRRVVGAGGARKEPARGAAEGCGPDAAIDAQWQRRPPRARDGGAPRLPMQRWLLIDVKTIFGANGLYQWPRARDE